MVDHLPVAPSFKNGLTIPDLGTSACFLGESKFVVHLTEPASEIPTDLLIICPELDSRKATALIAAQNRPEIRTDNVNVPSILAIGNFNNSNTLQYYWIEELHSGITLTEQVHKGFAYEGYNALVNWLAKFHQLSQVEMPLSSLYDSRMNIIHNWLDKLYCLEDRLSLSRLKTSIDTAYANSQPGVDSNEVVHNIHGDFRAGNILVTGDLSFSVIDFEAGLSGGDIYDDLERLLCLTDHRTPDPNTPLSYRPTLGKQEKMALISNYVNARAQLGWKATQALEDYAAGRSKTPALKARHNLHYLDNRLRAMVRYLYKYNRDGQDEDLKQANLLLNHLISRFNWNN